MQRLQKVIADAGVASRRKAEKLIAAGRVRVNGSPVTQLGTKVDPAEDHIEVDGKPIDAEEKVYYLFYKPRKVITSVSDNLGRRVVTDYFKHVTQRIYPVGRLDYDSEGLLLMTNDGALAHVMMHPRFEIAKTYLVRVKGAPHAAALAQLARGIMLDDGMTAPAKVSLVQSERTSSWIRLTIHEGRNRQVRRMCEAVGHPVKRLVREQIGFLHVSGLKPGEFRPLTAAEVKKLQQRHKR